MSVSGRINTHDYYLAETINEAKIAYEKGNLPVGALLVDTDGNIIARSQNSMRTNKGYAYHAEIELIFSKQNYLLDHQYSITLYSSLEPCIMCFGAAVISRIAKIVWAANDYWAGGTRSYNFDSDYLKSRMINLIPPFSTFLQKQSVSLLAKYFSIHDPEKVTLVLRDQVNFRK